jgi:hypothetical protein
MWTKAVTVVETPTFSRQAEGVWTGEEGSAFVDYIARNPEAGDVVAQTGGVRKVRWIRQGSGKRGGARVIYFYQHAEAPLYLLLVYAKAQRENMTAEEKKAVRAIADVLKRAHRRSAGKDAI